MRRGVPGARLFVETMALWRPLRRDVRRVLQGSVAFFGYLRTSELVEIGLDQLSAASRVVVRGQPNRYVATICNAGVEPRGVTLAIDIRSVASPASQDAAYACFSRHVTVPPRRSTRIEIEYDWFTKVDFVVDGANCLPGDVRMGSLDRCTQYAVNASLLEADGHCVERLTIYQELSR